MSLPDYNRAMAQFSEAPALDDTSGAYSGKTRFFHFSTNKTAALVLVAGFFDFARDRLRVGDVIFAVADVDGTPDLLMLRVATVPASPSNVTVLAEAGDYAAAAPANVTIALAASATTDGMDITMTVVDKNGTAIAQVFELEWWISESAIGAGLTADTYSGDVTTVTGTELQEIVSKKHFKSLSDANGVVGALAVASANPTDQYIAVKHPVTGQIIVSAISGTNWEGA